MIAGLFSSDRFPAESHLSVYGGVCNSLGSPCVGVALCSDRITHPWTFQPGAAGSSFRSSGAAIHALCDSLHSCSPIGRLFHSRERQAGEGGRPPASGGAGGSFYTVSDEIDV